MSKKVGSGWYCQMVGVERRCIPFKDYTKHGWKLEESRLYEEVFPNDPLDKER